jgi:uroporphyrinogen decarboxylase
MTPKERLLTVLRGGIPDRVPVSPDFSNMIPAKITGKPFWDLYLYNDPPIHEAYIDCAKRFNIDALMDGYFPYEYAGEAEPNQGWEIFIVFKNATRIVTQSSRKEKGTRVWRPWISVYPIDNPPTYKVLPAAIGLPQIPAQFEPLKGVKHVDRSATGLTRIKNMMGEQGLVGIWLASTVPLSNEEKIYWYYDHPEEHEKVAEDAVIKVEERFKQIMTLEDKPDFLCIGGSGSFVFQTEEMFRKIAFPAVKRAIELSTNAGIPTHIHSCGPEKNLVRIMALETSLTVIDPLEVPPMGDCALADLKKAYGKKLTLKGNLHTTDIMLRGSVDDVISASKQAIDDAAEGGRFILSTGDQCGRDTPFDNLEAMIETAKSYGRYF